MISVIVPLLNEREALPAFLEAADGWDCVDEVIFVDGGSTDGSLELLANETVLTGVRGRGAQCRLGLEHARGDAFVFVHADSVVPAESMRAIANALDSGVQWGCLTLRFTTHTLDRRIGAWSSNARVRWTGIPFGDQVIFVTRTLYEQVGGMPDIPLMEDYELSLRLRSHVWPKQLRQVVYTSPRRFEQGGNIKTMVEMRRLRWLYRQGVSPQKLAELYNGGKQPRSDDRP